MNIINKSHSYFKHLGHSSLHRELPGLLMLVIALIAGTSQAFAWMHMDMPQLHVEGRYLKDTHGNIVNLHGFAQTYSPWFNEQGSQWSNYNVNDCLNYNRHKIDQILDAGWDVNFLRMHMDPYWSNKPGVHTTGENDISAFDFERFKKYLDEVFVPMAEYAISKGLYVVMRPPGVCPDNIAVGDAYHQYLIKVWGHVATHPKLRNHPNVMFELANEPINIKGTDGNYGNNGRACFDALKDFFQEIVDTMRDADCRNILWIPGLCWQMHYAGFADNPIEGDNIGYAVHLYPGWFGSSSSFTDFQSGWDADVKPVADIAPIMVTEMDWADEKYNASWGKAHTGEPYGEGSDNFGANFKLIMDNSGNCSWLLFTGPEWLAKFVDEPGTPGNYTFLNDPEACPWPIYHWYQEYRAQHDYPYPDFQHRLTSDCGDGYFNNPVIYGDFPDMDVIRVGDTYYMMSTTMFLFPGATIMRSYDLVNWEYCANPIDYIELDEAYNLENGNNRYARGMWASAFQYNERDGKFYILFNTLNEGAYLMTATDPEGTWTKRRLNTSFYDCGILFDGDDTYVVHGNTNINISKVDADFNVIETHTVINGDPNNAVEGARIYHIGNYYYVYCTYCGYPGKQTCFRSTDVFGTYEERILLADNRAIHQGSLVQTGDGKWYTMLHRDYFGGARVPYLLPVTFNGGWPLIAKMVSNIDHLVKPVVNGYRRPAELVTNDMFRHYQLGKQWQWNHNPDASKWSLVENAGYLRLHTASVTNDLYQARNTLTQRIIGCHNDVEHNYGTVAIDISHMADGDRTGLAIFQDPLAGIGVKAEGGKKYFYYTTASLTGKNATVETDGAEITTDVVYLRAEVNLATSKAQFYYSTDNQVYNRLGDVFSLPYDLSVFIGNRYAIFNYATKALGGYVDVDWFSTEPVFAEEMFTSADFEPYSKESLTAVSVSSGIDELVVMTGSSASFGLTATFQDGHTENVAGQAVYTVSNPDILAVRAGSIRGLRDGQATVTATYTDPMGTAHTTTFTVESTTFPLITGLFNPSIWEKGTFDEETHTVTTGQYGFAGWHYDAGVNLDDYKYLVVKVAKSPQAGGLSFRIFDENNYWAGCASMPKKNASDYDYFVCTLHNTWKDDNSRKIDPSHIYYVGFWTYGGQKFIINDIYLTNDDHYLDHTGIADVIADAEARVDVYTVSGQLVMRGVTRAQAIVELPSGLYIIGGRKVMIRR